MSIDSRMRDLSHEAERLRTEIAILVEQVAFQRTVFDDARLRALVSETPIADRDAQEAFTDLRRLEASLEEAQARLVAVTGELDTLLERMIDPA
jgi:predicted  nucleic acid-binding Zn-ribbon protein